MDKIGQSGGFLGRILGPLLKTVSPVIGNVLKRVLISLELTAAASATDAGIHKKIFGSGMTTLIIANEKMNDIMKIVKSFKKKKTRKRGISQIVIRWIRC